MTLQHRLADSKPKPTRGTKDWATEEYGLTSTELNRACKNLLRTGKQLLQGSGTVSWTNFKKQRKQ